MTKHTPGPWKVNPNAGEVRGADWNIIVADVPHDADAHLIAAAPEMLAATDALLRFIDEHQFHQSGDDVMFPWPPLRDLTEKTREAIAKARGQG